MSTDGFYRLVGDVRIKGKSSSHGLSKGEKVDISYGLDRSTNPQQIAIVQRCQPLTPERPFFLVEIQECGPKAILSIGIASSKLDRHTGHFINTLGYFNNSGRVTTSCKSNANTLGLPYGRGNRIGIYVTHFGRHSSTVLIFRDNVPTATRYHFETNHENFLPTITFAGTVSLVSVYWPEAVNQLPSIDDMPISRWILGPTANFNSRSGTFENRSKLEDLPIQSPIPLGKSFHCFIVTQQEVSPTDGKGASVGLTTFSPLKPTPTCPLMKDYYTWSSKMKMKVGNSIGWGVFYEESSNDDKAEQLCLVFVMFNKTIIDGLFVLQPEGGFLPIVLLQPFATKVSIERKNVLSPDEIERLEKLYQQLLGPAIDVYRRDLTERDLPLNLFRKSEQVLMEIDEHSCRILIPKCETTVHYVQFCKPLTPERRYFFVELELINEQTEVIIGIASAEHELNEAPGLDRDTVGYNSLTGQLFSNRKDTGNMRGHRCRMGDQMGVEIEAFGKEMSVVLFTKNFRPVGTRYLTLKDAKQFFPTILIESNGEPVEILVHWQTRVSLPTSFNLKNPEDWCLPEKASVDTKENLFLLPSHLDHSLCLQGPCSLNKKLNHFEIVLIDKFNEVDPPPAISLCTASPMDPPSTSPFRQDFLRFWPTGDAGKYLKQGDKIGWGVLYPPPGETRSTREDEQLIICFLTINRQVNYVRVLYQPVGGFYPVIVAPPTVNRIQMDFSSTQISPEEFTMDQIQTILTEARLQLDEDKRSIQSPDYQREESQMSYPVNDLRHDDNFMINQFQPTMTPSTTQRPYEPLQTTNVNYDDVENDDDDDDDQRKEVVKSSTCTIN